MRDIYAMNFISFRIYLITIKRTPSKTGRTYEEMVKQKHTVQQLLFRQSTKPNGDNGSKAPTNVWTYVYGQVASPWF